MQEQIVTVKDAGKVATALANEKCQRILQHLRTHEDATETELAKALKIPLSTVHYNVKVLKDAGLVRADTWSYSVKGKTVTHYRVPKEEVTIVQERSILDNLKAITPAAVIAAGIGIAYFLLTQSQLTPTSEAKTMLAAAPEMQALAAPVAQASQATPSMMPAFLAGVVMTAVLTLIAFFVLRVWEKRKR